MPLTTTDSLDGSEKEVVKPEDNPDEQPPYGTAPVPGHADIMHALGTGERIADTLAEGVKASAEGVPFEDKALSEAEAVEESDADKEAREKRVENTKPFVDAVAEAREELTSEAEEAAEAQEKAQAESAQDRADAVVQAGGAESRTEAGKKAK